MGYRFLNTIIDDLFSFIIKMPTMHRISCFRDDVIFVIYLYQRYTYRVDKSRGLYATEEKKKAISPERAEAKKKVEEKQTIQAVSKKSRKVQYAKSETETQPESKQVG